MTSKPNARLNTEDRPFLNESNFSVLDIEEDDIQMKIKEEVPR
jgi:hypothetical protein